MSSRMSRKKRAALRHRAERAQARRRELRLARVESARRAELILHPPPRRCDHADWRQTSRRRAQSMSLPGRVRRRLLRLIRAAPSTLLSEQGLRVLAEIARHPWLVRPEKLSREPTSAADFLTRLLLAWPLPPFMMRALLYPGQTPMRSADLRWVVGLAVRLGRGESPRGCPVLARLTHQMRARFMATSRVDPVPALRRAQVLGAGGRGTLATALVRTRLRYLQDDEAWWHGVIVWMAGRRTLPAHQVGVLVQWLAALRAGGSDYDPRGRPVPSVLRRMEADLPRLSDEPDWPASGLRGLTDGPWSLAEISSEVMLLEEGRSMSHCIWGRRVAVLAQTSAVLSLRRDGRRVGTVEVSLLWRRLAEVRGPANRTLSADARAVVQRWAARERLATSGCAW